MFSLVTKKQNPEEFEKDVAARQRNIVFPDTVANEARFWRTVIQGKRQLKAFQLVGFAVTFVIIGSVYLSVFSDIFDRPSSLIGYLIPVVIVGVFLLAIKISSRSKSHRS